MCERKAKDRIIYAEQMLVGKSFDNLILCDEHSERVDVFVRASLRGGALSVSGQDLGPVVEETWGDDDYEYWYIFTAEETFRLLKAIDGLLDPERAVLEHFSGMDGCAAMREICEREGISYSFESYV